MKTKLLLVATAIICSITFLIMPIAASFNTPLTEPIIIQYDNSSGVQEAVSTLVSIYPNAQVIKYQAKDNFWTKLTLQRSIDQIILVGHGSAQGIKGPDNTIHSWTETAQWVNSLPNAEVYFVSCDSQIATTLIHKKSFGFNGAVDAKIAALSVSMQYFASQGLTSRVQQVYHQYISQVLGLEHGTVKANYLQVICINSVTSASTALVTCPPLPPPPPPTPQPKVIQASLLGSCTLQPSDPLYNANPQPTYVMYCLSPTEAEYWGVILIADLVAGWGGISEASSVYQVLKNAIKIHVNLNTVFMIDFNAQEWKNGAITFEAFAQAVAGSMLDILNAVISALTTHIWDPLFWITVVAGIVTALGVIAVGGPAAVAVAIGLQIVIVSNDILSMRDDELDTNTYVG